MSIEEIEARAAKATPGPWFWGGYVDSIRLSTVDRGRIFVMGFKRKGMNGAEPTFQVYGEGHIGDGSGRMTAASDMAIREASYRDDIVAIDNPDADFIAHSREDIDFLLAEVKRLREDASVGV